SAVRAKDESPLPVDPDGMQSGQIASQLFEMVAGRHSQILVGMASSIIWSFRNTRSSRSVGISLDRMSAIKKSRSQASRKLAIIPRLRDELMYHSMVQKASGAPDTDQHDVATDGF